MRNFWNKLTMNQRYTLAAGGAIAVFLLIVQFVFSPIYDARESSTRAIETNQRTINELIPLASEYRSLKREVAHVRKVIAERPQGFNLYSYVEKKSGEAAVKGHVRNITPSKSSDAGFYEEASVDVKIESVTLRQLTNFIYLLESPQELIRVTRLTVAKNKEAPEYLDALFNVMTYTMPKR